MSSPNSELQGPEKNPESSEHPHARAFKDREDSDQPTSNYVVSPPVQWSFNSAAELSALKDFLSGDSTAPTILNSTDTDVRQLVTAELLAAITGSKEEATSRFQDHPPSSFEQPDNRDPTLTKNHSSGNQKQERARQLFVDYGYLDEAINSLRATESPEERAKAARTLGIVGSQRGTVPLIAALFDDAPEVRKAAEEALGQIGDPSVSIGHMNTMIGNDLDYQAPSGGSPLEAEVVAVEKTKTGSTEEVGTAHVDFEGENISLEQTNVSKPDGVSEASPVLDEIDQIRNDLAELEGQLLKAVAARKEADREVFVRAEQESALRADAAARRREDEEARKRAEEKAARRRSEDDRKIAAEQLGRVQAELEAQRLAEEEERLRLEASNLRQIAWDLARQRAEFEDNELGIAAEARRVEAENTLRKAKERYHAELEQLRLEEEALNRATEKAAAKRIEVEGQRREAETQARQFEEDKKQLNEAIAARDAEARRLREIEAQVRSEQKELNQQVETLLRAREQVAKRRTEVEGERVNVVAELEQLKEANERIQDAERIRRETETERLQLEAELRQRVEKEQALLAEIRRQADGERQRLEEASRLRAQEQDRRLAELEALRAEIEREAQLRVEKERQLNSEIESLRAAESEALAHFRQVESLRNRAEETHHVAAEKVQRIEAEARRRTMEDQRVLDKLEETRRNIDLEAHARAEQEKHLKEEIEALRRFEKEERNRIAQISSNRAEAEARLHRVRERLKLEEEALAKAESQIEFLLEGQGDPAETSVWYDDPVGNLGSLSQPGVDEVPVVLTEKFVASASEESPVVNEFSKVSVSPESFLMALRSADPYRRMAALAGLARHGHSEAFDLIAGCFDDPSPQVRNAAARALRDREPERTVESFTRAIEEGSPERARTIGVAIAASGLASEALHTLSAESREDTYKSLSLLFVMAKTGEIQPLVQAIEEHPEPEVRSAAIKLLSLSGQSAAAESALQRRREKGS